MTGVPFSEPPGGVPGGVLVVVIVGPLGKSFPAFSSIAVLLNFGSASEVV